MDWKERYEQEYAIVDRCWIALGIRSYDAAGGKAIDQLIRERCHTSFEVDNPNDHAITVKVNGESFLIGPGCSSSLTVTPLPQKECK